MNLLPTFSASELMLIFLGIFLLRIALFTFLERRYVAQTFEWKQVIRDDLLTMLFYIFIIYPVAQVVSNTIGVGVFVPHALAELPLIIRVVLYLILADFMHYWLHRLMHTRFVWRIHKWHHMPTHMSFMGGFRASFLDATVVNLAYIFAWPLLGPASLGLQFSLLLFALIRNDWMHLNIRMRFPMLEKVLVTPRYHHIHHSSEPRYYESNLSPFFSIWDRLFGTYTDPDTVGSELQFGVREKQHPLRLVTGL